MVLEEEGGEKLDKEIIVVSCAKHSGLRGIQNGRKMKLRVETDDYVCPVCGDVKFITENGFALPIKYRVGTVEHAIHVVEVLEGQVKEILRKTVEDLNDIIDS